MTKPDKLLSTYILAATFTILALLPSLAVAQIDEDGQPAFLSIDQEPGQFAYRIHSHAEVPNGFRQWVEWKEWRINDDDEPGRALYDDHHQFGSNPDWPDHFYHNSPQFCWHDWHNGRCLITAVLYYNDLGGARHVLASVSQIIDNGIPDPWDD